MKAQRSIFLYFSRKVYIFFSRKIFWNCSTTFSKNKKNNCLRFLLACVCIPTCMCILVLQALRSKCPLCRICQNSYEPHNSSHKSTSCPQTEFAINMLQVAHPPFSNREKLPTEWLHEKMQSCSWFSHSSRTCKELQNLKGQNYPLYCTTIPNAHKLETHSWVQEKNNILNNSLQKRLLDNIDMKILPDIYTLLFNFFKDKQVKTDTQLYWAIY